MFKKTTCALVAAAVTAIAGNAAFADGHGEITVAYFLEWPMPMMAAKASGAYDEALGTKVNWVSFETGTAMSAAMASGDIQISLSQGVPPFVVAASAGQSIQVVDVAVSYSDNATVLFPRHLKSTKTALANWLARKLQFHSAQPHITASCAKWTTSAFRLMA